MCVEVVDVVESDVALEAGGSFVRRCGYGRGCHGTSGEEGRAARRNRLTLFQAAVHHLRHLSQDF